MAQYPKLRTTNKGRDLISTANNNQKAIIFTKIVIGDGTTTTSIDSMTSVVSPKMELPLSPFGSLTNGEFKLMGTLDNSSLTEGFYAKEIGVCAKVDGGTEVLFAYTNGGNYVDYIPDKSTPIDAQIVKVQFVVGDATNLSIQISNDTYITYLELDNHNTNATAHTDIRAKITSDINAHNTSSSAHTAILNAIKAISGMAAYDTAPSMSLASLIPLVGYGGIVAQRLEANGYVKFANSFTVQWGSTNAVGRDVTITFPIQFSTKCFCGLVTAQKSSGSLEGSQCNAYVRPANTTGMVVGMYDYTNTGWYWLAIGI